MPLSLDPMPARAVRARHISANQISLGTWEDTFLIFMGVTNSDGATPCFWGIHVVFFGVGSCVTTLASQSNVSMQIISVVLGIMHYLVLFSCCLLTNRAFSAKKNADVMNAMSFRRIFSLVVMYPTLVLFTTHVGFEDAFSAPGGLHGHSSAVETRFRVLVASLYAALQSLSTVGYGDFTPIQWYSQLFVLPLYINSFLVMATLYGTFAELLSVKSDT